MIAVGRLRGRLTLRVAVVGGLLSIEEEAELAGNVCNRDGRRHHDRQVRMRGMGAVFLGSVRDGKWRVARVVISLVLRLRRTVAARVVAWVSRHVGAGERVLG